MPGRSAEKVAQWRRDTKIKLIEHHGGACVDCGFKGLPFQMDFDHRDPTEKEFGLGTAGISRSYARQLAESLKCDLVCANCHRTRTHRQRCPGCVWCQP